MSNTTPRAIRIDDDLWAESLAVTAEQGTSVSEVCRAALAANNRRHRRAASSGPTTTH